MRIPLRLLTLFIVLIGLSGCHETDYEFWINPDGSGKVTIHSVFPSMAAWNQKSSSLDFQLKKTINQVLSGSQGVSFWDELEYGWRKDGKIMFSGVAYFEDITAVKFQHMASPFRITVIKGSDGTTSYELSIKEGSEFGFGIPGEPVQNEDPAKWSEEDIQTKILHARVAFQSAQQMLQQIFSSMRGSIRMHVPGRIETVNHIKQEGPQTVFIQWNGNDWYKRFEEWIHDNASLRPLVMKQTGIRAGLNDPQLSTQIVLGSSTSPFAKAKDSGQFFFDYIQSVKEKQAAYQQTLAHLKETVEQMEPANTQASVNMSYKSPEKPKPTPQPISEGQGFSAIDVIGVRLIYCGGEQIYILGVNTNQSSLGLGLRGVLPGGIESFEEGRVEKAETLNGENLLPSDEFQRRIGLIQMSDDKTRATFDVSLLAPSPEAIGLKEVSGYLQYFIPGSTKNLKLEKKAFKEGQEWKEQNVKISYFGQSRYSASKNEIELQVELDPKSIKEVTILDSSGQTVPIKPVGRSRRGEIVTLTYQSDAALPSSGSIIFELYANYKLGKVPFKVENFDFMGQPLHQ